MWGSWELIQLCNTGSDEGNPVYHSQPLGTALGDSGRGVGEQALLRPGSGAGRGQRGGTGCGLGGEEVARLAEVDDDGGEDGDEEAAYGDTVGWKERWIRLLSFALARGVAGLIIRRAVGRCPAGGGWRWAGGVRVRGGMGRGEAAGWEEMGRLVLMDREWEDAIEETDYARQDRHGGETQESGGEQHEQSEKASAGAGEAGRMGVKESAPPRLGLEGRRRAQAGAGGPIQAASRVEAILAEWDDLSSPGLEGGVWTQKQSGASPEQAMALAEEGVDTLIRVSRRVASLLEGAVGMGGTGEGAEGDVGGRATVGMGPQVGTVRRDSYSASVERIAQVRGHLARQSAQRLQSHRVVAGGRGLQAQIGGRGEPAWKTQQQCVGRAVAEGLSSGGKGELAPETWQQRTGGADAEGFGWPSEAERDPFLTHEVQRIRISVPKCVLKPLIPGEGTQCSRSFVVM
ncbi:hypothetical protein CYMTET_43150 [Cymbomonas tetramitiformis]|uniref:Uncharacterized protein n=1 Tax=Cymbomonas tetramitiformis TaxID=36881 RepID=A0AAE0C3U7_9CHLO|nr:hypothetical protein CYMTET_43150 [Cymbomonas tetramitiformis]